jgi:Sir2 family
MSHPSSLSLTDDIRRRLAAARSVVAFTGAGVSKESGLDTFRDADGVWQKVRPEDMATPQASGATRRASGGGTPSASRGPPASPPTRRTSPLQGGSACFRPLLW